MPEHYIAIDNVCGWPNLTLLPDGTIIATIFNQPCHGAWEGDVECWASTDHGRSWTLRGTPAPHEPARNRMNVSAGLTNNGDLMVIASGWDRRPAKGQPRPADYKMHVDDCLQPWVSRSSDGGKTWTIDKTGFPERVAANYFRYIPFGDILPGDKGTLATCAYTNTLESESGKYGESNAFFVVSDDDGKSWREPVKIGNGDQNETTPLHLGGGEWIVAARTAKLAHLELFRSRDNGSSWAFEQNLSLPSQHPAQLLKLQDGHILLTYGGRCRGHFGVYVRRSADGGKTWDAPRQIKHYGDVDSGYPSSAQHADGSLTSAYYCSRQEQHQRYHVGSVVWTLKEIYG